MNSLTAWADLPICNVTGRSAGLDLSSVRLKILLSGYLLSIRNDTIHSLMNFMASRLKLGDDLQSSSSSLRAFCNFTATSEDIRAVLKLFVPDVDLAVLAQEYEDIQALSPKPTDLRQVHRIICSSKYPSPSSLARSTTLARIWVCKPQSADCERLISAYDRLKSWQRNSLEHATIGNYLYII